MSEELNEPQEALTPEPETTPEEAVVVDPDVELDMEALQAKANKADEYKSYADRTAKENKELKKFLKTNESPPDSDARFERLELKTEGYKSDEVDFLMQNGGRKALDNKLVMAGIEAIRKEAKSKDATPSGTGKSTVFQKYTDQDLKRMPLEELDKILPHA